MAGLHAEDSLAFDEKATVARLLPGGWVQKIVWCKELGCPPHAYGYTQYTARPYRPGYGCDGTTDANVHLIAMTVCQRLGIDYAAAYEEAYSDNDRDIGTALEWLASLPDDDALQAETLAPADAAHDTLVLMLSDLYQINNRALVSVLEDKLAALGHDVTNWFNEETALRAWAREAKPLHTERFEYENGVKIEIRPLTQAIFNRFIKDKQKPGFASNLQEYLVKLPRNTHAAIEFQPFGVVGDGRLLRVASDSAVSQGFAFRRYSGSPARDRMTA